MADDLKVISLKLDQLTEIHERSDEKLSDVRTRLYDPDDGIFSRMKDMHSWAEKHEQADEDRHKQIMAWTAEHEKDDTELHKTVTKMAETMVPLVDDYKLRVSRKKWTDKIVLIVLGIIVTALIPTVWQVLTMDRSVPAKMDKQK